ncbi:hypothetical protein CBR_g38083 [Chara braunii]|uniref:Reverse transcriptase n=1 Tax=Chara braunii TaxID=69332 RepID=A0A388K0B7_CHABU|nr:hypothetical protein CBR_g38083 [Chara braunii]|eukprot:GBG63465.1 hypothetical protein CBR_g38083 [Chara braunii]
MDDILVFSKTHEYHVEHIERVLHALKDAGFKVALEKSEFCLSEISFLGYIVTVDGLKPDLRKVAAVQDAPAPVTLTQVRAFLGLASYYRRFIKGFAGIAKPLTNLPKKEEQLIWTLECEAAFQALKEALTSTPVLARPDPTRPFALYTDWQPQAISAVLTQPDKDGRKHVIEYASKTLSQAQANYEACKGECLAVVWGIQRFRPYLYGQKFVLVTDHQPLLSLRNNTDYTGTLGRWAVRLQDYDFDIRHRATRQHGNVDGLTRLMPPNKCPANERLIPWRPEVAATKPHYGELHALRDSLLELTKAERRRVTERAQDYRWQGPTLQKRKVDDDGESSWLMVPHPLARFDWTRAAHEEDAVHFTVKYTEEAIEKNGWYWLGIREDVKYIVQNCPACAADKAPVQMPRTMVPTRVERPFQRVSIDTTDINVPRGPVDQGELNVLLVAVDHFSKWIEAYPMTSRNSQEVARYVNRFLCMDLEVEEVHMDNGSGFQGEVERHLVRADVKIIYSPGHWPQANGLVENANRLIKTALRRNITAGDTRPWPVIVDHILAVYRATPHGSTGVSPFQLRTNSVPQLRYDIQQVNVPAPGVADLAAYSLLCDRLMYAGVYVDVTQLPGRETTRVFIEFRALQVAPNFVHSVATFIGDLTILPQPNREPARSFVREYAVEAARSVARLQGRGGHRFTTHKVLLRRAEDGPIALVPQLPALVPPAAPLNFQAIPPIPRVGVAPCAVQVGGAGDLGLLELIHLELLSIAQVIASEEEKIQPRLRTATAPRRTYNEVIIPDYIAQRAERLEDFPEERPLRPPSSYPRPAPLKAPKKTTKRKRRHPSPGAQGSRIDDGEEVIQPARTRIPDPVPGSGATLVKETIVPSPPIPRVPDLNLDGAGPSSAAAAGGGSRMGFPDPISRPPVLAGPLRTSKMELELWRHRGGSARFVRRRQVFGKWCRGGAARFARRRQCGLLTYCGSAADFCGDSTGFSGGGAGALPKFCGGGIGLTTVDNLLADKVLAQIAGSERWTKLSLFGRALVLSTTAFSLLCFPLSIHLLGDTAYRKIKKTATRYLWKPDATADQGFLSKLAWEVVVIPKKKGGLGILDPRQQNTALLAKWPVKAMTDLDDKIWKEMAEYVVQGSEWDLQDHSKAGGRTGFSSFNYEKFSVALCILSDWRGSECAAVKQPGFGNVRGIINAHQVAGEKSVVGGSIMRYDPYKFVVMPFGLCNAPGTFQHAMNRIFHEYLDKFIVVYLDDILIFSRTVEEHAEHLKIVLGLLRQHRYKMNFEKCEFGRTKILYLGHEIFAEGLRPDDAKVASIRDWPKPQTVTEVRSFLGMTGYYRPFVKNYSTIASPLTDLTRLDTPWAWPEECEAPFKKLKYALTHYEVLKLADPEHPFVVTIDASQYGIGAVLAQKEGKKFRPIEYMSKKMTSQKLAKSTYEHELYALYRALVNWRYYLLDRFFYVRSDHETLHWIKTQPVLSDALKRWIQVIDMYDYQFDPIKGEYNKVADALSRRVDYLGALVTEFGISDELTRSLVEAYREDPVLSEIIRKLEAKDKATSDEFVLTYCSTTPVAEESQVAFSTSCLGGEAKAWVLAEANTAGFDDIGKWAGTMTLKQFLDKIKERFLDKTTTDKAFDQLTTIGQKHWTSVQALSHEVDRLLQVPGLNLQDDQVLYIYARALPEPIRSQLVAESKSGAGARYGKRVLWRQKRQDHMLAVFDDDTMEKLPLEEEGVLSNSESGKGDVTDAVVNKGGPRGLYRGRKPRSFPAHPGIAAFKPWEKMEIDQKTWQDRMDIAQCLKCGKEGHIIAWCPLIRHPKANRQ